MSPCTSDEGTPGVTGVTGSRLAAGSAGTAVGLGWPFDRDPVLLAERPFAPADVRAPFVRGVGLGLAGTTSGAAGSGALAVAGSGALAVAGSGALGGAGVGTFDGPAPPSCSVGMPAAKSSGDSCALSCAAAATPCLRTSSMKSLRTRCASWHPRLYASRIARLSARVSAGENGMRRKRSSRGWSPGQMRCSTVTVPWRQLRNTGSRAVALRTEARSRICCSSHSMARVAAGVRLMTRSRATHHQSE